MVVTRRLPPQVEARMSELFDVRLREDDDPWDRATLIAALQEADVLVTCLTDRISAEVIAAAPPRLRLIANYGAGVDHVDLLAAWERGIQITNTPGATSADTADMTLGLILALARRLPEGVEVMRGGDWQGWAPTAMLGRRVAGMRLAILGMGRIGQAVARRAAAFGMEVSYHNRRRLRPEIEASHGATWWSSLDQMVARADVLSVHCPHTPSTYHLINARRLALMQPGAMVVNTSRGEVVDENALTRMLRAGHLAGAALDVHAQSRGVNPRLAALPNVILLPHMASATLQGRIEMGERAILNIQTFADGHQPPDLVVPGAA